MWEFVKANHGAISAVATVVTLIVWALYFQLLLNSYRHRVRPKININRGGGPSTSSRCVISNMSAEAVYVEAIILTLRDGDKRRVCYLSDLDVSLSSDRDERTQLFQGPLAAGEFIDIGSFDGLIERASDTFERGDMIAADAHRLEVMVVATYTAEGGLIAAERRYDLDRRGGQGILTPITFTTRQIRSRKERRNIERIILDWYERGASASPADGA